MRKIGAPTNKKLEHLNELERSAVERVNSDYKFLLGIESYRKMSAKEQLVVRLVRASSIVALRFLPVPSQRENYKMFFDTTCMPVVDNVLSEVNEETPINITMAKEFIYSTWLDRARIAVGEVTDQRLFDLFYQNPSHPEALKKLIGSIAEREAQCQ